jgi:ketosteroid isomerase-like protein
VSTSASRAATRATPAILHLVAGNLQTIRSLHSDAAGRLTWDDLLALLDDDVEWWVAGPADRFPWAGTHRGPEGVRGWSALLDEQLEYDAFELVEAWQDGDTVIELVRASGTARETGKRFESEVVRLWTFHDGRVVRVRSYYDTANYLAAVGGAY